MNRARASMARQDDRISRPRLYEIGATAVAALRDKMVDYGVIRFADFSAGTLLVGVMAQKDFRSRVRARKGDARSFLDAMVLEYQRFQESLGNGDYSRAIESLRQPRMGSVDASPEELVTAVGLAGGDLVEKLGHEFRMSKSELMQAIAFGCLLAVWAQSRPGMEQEGLDAFIETAPPMIDEFDIMTPSRKELFG